MSACEPVESWIVSDPAPPSKVSLFPSPALTIFIVSAAPPPLRVSVPAPPVIVKASVWFVRSTLEPSAWALTISTFCNLLSVVNVWTPEDNCKVSDPAPPLTVSALP